MTATPRGTGCQTSTPPIPSRSNSSPSSHLTLSPDNSTDSPDSSTSQRGRPSNRYPDSLGRVPLHRRGTSNTYERLEDLLREAGYKETRVFTPETDRKTRTAGGKRDGGVENNTRSSVGAVVDFITGLVSRASSLSREAAPLEDNSTPTLRAWSPPPSPLTHALHIRDERTKQATSMASLSRSGSSENVRRRTFMGSTADPSHHTRTCQVVQLQPSRGLPHHPFKHKTHHHHPNNRHQFNHSSKSSFTKPNPSNARAYLRHMASAPNIQPLMKRPSLSEASLRSHVIGREVQNGNAMRHTVILNDEATVAEPEYESRPRVTMVDDDHQVPPLPRNWMESVAKALLNGVGGPATVPSDAASTRTAKTASTRKSSGVSDKSSQDRGRSLMKTTRPPLLCIQVQDMKARTSEGQVICTRVMCRSTPTSRASSRVRNSGCDDQMSISSRGKRREGNKPKNYQRGKDKDAVPSLARTRAENDAWMAPHHRYPSGWGMQGGTQAHPDGAWSDDSDGEEDEDEEGELGLDRLLVPARRQRSIRSLRKHLHRPPSRMFSGHGMSRPGSPTSGRASPFGAAPASRLDWRDASWSTSHGREWLTSQSEEGEDGYPFPGAGEGIGRSNTKWRRGLPGLTQWTTSP